MIISLYCTYKSIACRKGCIYPPGKINGGEYQYTHERVPFLIIIKMSLLALCLTTTLLGCPLRIKSIILVFLFLSFIISFSLYFSILYIYILLIQILHSTSVNVRLYYRFIALFFILAILQSYSSSQSIYYWSLPVFHKKAKLVSKLIFLTLRIVSSRSVARQI